MANTTGEGSKWTNTAQSWDMRDAPVFMGDSTEAPMPEQSEVPAPDAKTEVVFWSNEYNTTEQQFFRYTQALKSSDFDGDSRSEHYRESLKKYEDDIRYEWTRLQESTTKAMAHQLIRSEYELADTQQLGVVKPEDTIEAATGIFYDERAKALNAEILASEEDDERRSDQTILRQTWRKVMDYVEAAADYEFLHRDYDAYQSMRRSCHNNMIQQLNDLNHLAEKYGTERFTPRDFMKNDFHYVQKRDRGGNLNHRVDYDRETVLAYFQTAFRGDFDKTMKKAKTQERGMITGVSYYD